MQTLEFKIVQPTDYPHALPLVIQLNPKTEPALLLERLKALPQSGYELLGAFEQGKLIGICGMWVHRRLYIGKLMEIDNVAIDEAYRSSGLGAKMMQWVEAYARKLGCESIELNTYVGNHRSHKFYYNQGYKILGYHMQKRLS